MISSNPDAYALTRAKENGIGTRVIVPKEFESREVYSKVLLEALFQEYADLIVLAGFMTILDETIIRAYHQCASVSDSGILRRRLLWTSCA